MRLHPSVSVVLALMISSVAAAAAAPSADAILARWVEVTGGKAAMEKIRTRSARGTLEITAMGVKGGMVYKAKQPNQRLTEIDLAGWGVVREGFDGQVGWVLNPGAAVMEKSGKDLARARREAVFQRELRFKELYPKLEVTGAAKVQGKDAWVLEATAADGDTEKYFFDAKDGLLLKQEASVETPAGTMNTEILFEDYRTVDGLRMAHTVRMVQPQEMAFTLRFTEVTLNTPVADSEFKRPQ